MATQSLAATVAENRRNAKQDESSAERLYCESLLLVQNLSFSSNMCESERQIWRTFADWNSELTDQASPIRQVCLRCKKKYHRNWIGQHINVMHKACIQCGDKITDNRCRFCVFKSNSVDRLVPEFARSPSSSAAATNPSTLLQQQQQQQQQIHEQQQQQQQALQQQRMFQQQFSQTQSTLQQQQQQQMYQLRMNPAYGQLAQQLLDHEKTSAPGPSHQPPSSNQLANSYYPSPSYTDNSVLGQLNLATMAQRGIKQFDGFNNDQPVNDSILAAIIEQKKSQPVLPSSGYMHAAQEQPPPFVGPSSSVTSQRMGMMRPQPQPQPFVTTPQQPPPGFGSLGAAPSNQGTVSQRQMYQFQQGPQQAPQFNPLTPLDWNTVQQQQQRQANPQNPSQTAPTKWNNWNNI